MGRVCTPTSKNAVPRSLGKDKGFDEISALGDGVEEELFRVFSYKEKLGDPQWSEDTLKDPEVGLAQPPRSFQRWLLVTSFQLVYSSVNTGMGLFVLPTEAERLNKGSASVWLGIYLAICGIAQLVCPIAGKLSDRHCSRWGRRRPFVFVGGIVSIASFAAMGIASLMVWPAVFVTGLFMGQFSLNVAYAAQCGLPADLQGITPDDNSEESNKENGVVSGAVALHSFCGSLVAMGIVIGTRSLPVQLEYPLYMAQLALVTVIVCLSASEAPTNVQAPKMALTLSDLWRSYSIDPKRDTDFLWVCVGRMCYYVSTSAVVFIKYYIRDMLHVDDEAQMRFQLGVLVVSAQLVGALFAIPFSRLSNKLGRKKVIYMACAIMFCTYTLYIIAPKVGSHGSWPLVVVAGLCYGAGSGAYLSVDYALALDCLPVGKSTAEAFGLWGVVGFIGATVGPLFGGGLLSMSQENNLQEIDTNDGAQYGFWGYAFVMALLGCVMNVLVVIFTKKIEKAT